MDQHEVSCNLQNLVHLEEAKPVQLIRPHATCKPMTPQCQTSACITTAQGPTTHGQQGGCYQGCCHLDPALYRSFVSHLLGLCDRLHARPQCSPVQLPQSESPLNGSWYTEHRNVPPRSADTRPAPIPPLIARSVLQYEAGSHQP
jgi:hypothetical protein